MLPMNGFAGVLQPRVRDWWRYFNVYVKVDSSWRNKVTGLCGNNNGLATDDPTDQAILANTWNVTNIGAILSGMSVCTNSFAFAGCGDGSCYSRVAYILRVTL
jgi:hypothetical protein